MESKPAAEAPNHQQKQDGCFMALFDLIGGVLRILAYLSIILGAQCLLLLTAKEFNLNWVIEKYEHIFDRLSLSEREKKGIQEYIDAHPQGSSTEEGQEAAPTEKDSDGN